MNIAWFKELRTQNVEIGGIKGANLGEITNGNLRVPPGFVVTSNAYTKFLELGGLKGKIDEILNKPSLDNPSELEKASIEIRDLINKTPIPTGISTEIMDNYKKLSGQCGKEEEFVAVRSSPTSMDLPDSNLAGQQDTFLNIRGENILNAVANCWSSLFTPRAILSRKEKGLGHLSATIAVVVQKMINAEKSGVMFSVHPATGERDKVVIEAGWGLGEGVVSGAVIPDHYIISKSSSTPEVKEIVEKNLMCIRDPKTGKTAIVKTPREKIKARVLSDEEIQELKKLGIKGEKHFGKPLDMEWAFEAGDLFLLQARPITFFHHRKPGKKEECSRDAPDIIHTITQIKSNISSPHVASRIAPIADGVGLLRVEHLLMDIGVHPIKFIKDGNEKVLINKIVSGVRKVVKAFYPKPVWYRSLDAPTDEFRSLEGGDDEPVEPNPMLGWRGIRRGLEQRELLLAEFRAIKELIHEGYDNIGVMIPMVQHPGELREAKKIAMEAGVRPHRDIEFGIMVETPAAALTIEDFIEEGLDFVSLGTNDLTQYTLAVDRNNELVAPLYTEKHPAVMKLIEMTIKACKKAGVHTSICGHGDSDPDIAKKLVEFGISSISTNPHAVQAIRKAVASAEQGLFLEDERK